MRQLKFPSYEWLKALPLKKTHMRTNRNGEPFETEEHCEYTFTLFDTPVSVWGRFTYNEDDSRYIHFDVIEGGHTGQNSLGLALKFNKKNYQKICKHAQEVYESFCKELEKDTSYWWDCSPEEYHEDLF